MLTLIIGFILFVLNPTAGVVGLLVLALKGSYFLAYAVTWGIEIALVVLFWITSALLAVAFALFN